MGRTIASRHVPYWRTYYHLIWATRDREPLITPAMHEMLERSIRSSGQERHALIHAVGIMPDHIHVVISIPPGLAVATMIGQSQGSSSHLINTQRPLPDGAKFAWQGEYGVLSFHEKDLPGVLDYVNNQETRHASQRLSTAMETIGEDKQPPSGGFVG